MPLTPARQPSDWDWLSSKPLSENPFPHGPSCQNRHKSRQQKEPEARPKGCQEKMHLSSNHTKLSTTEKKRGMHVFCFFFFFFFNSACFCASDSMNVECFWYIHCMCGTLCLGAVRMIMPERNMLLPHLYFKGWRTPFELWTPVTFLQLSFKPFSSKDNYSEYKMDTTGAA